MDLLDELQNQVVPADGAMGTELWAAGAPREACLEELCVSQPERVRQVHEAYLAAGARLIETNTFGANAVRLARHGFEHRVSEINWTAAQLARDCAKAGGAQVAGSVGPLGFSAEEAAVRGIDREAVFLEQIGAILDGGVRVIMLETFTDLDELCLAIHVKHSLHHCPVIACVACGEEARLPDGTPLATAFVRLQAAEADIIGVNCTAVSPLLLDALAFVPPDSALAVFPSAGLPEEREGGLHYPVSPEQFARDGLALAGRGARLIGGCCGAGPAHIAALAAALGGEQTRRGGDTKKGADVRT
ncbi:MAG: methionine synthase / methylenetetrahydrofolate reductase [Chthoniobacter sp.]|jgi:homocysteine S-methyltransferase|nr:methionine synthase / methylenetetrahydrofolate reductase [Chthoniobacter sp.]